jgi:hypothetical protein
LREAASLLRDRNFVKGPGNPPQAVSMLPLGFLLTRGSSNDVKIWSF